MKRFFSCVVFCMLAARSFADAYITIDAPASVFSGVSYWVTTRADVTQDGYNDTFHLSVLKNGTYFSGASSGWIYGSATVSAVGSTADYGAQTVNYWAYGYDLYNYAESYASVNISVTNGVQIIRSSFDNSSPMPIGSSRPFTVTLKNIGGTTWSADATPHRLGRQNPTDDMTWGINRVDILAPGETLPPGSQKTMAVSLTAPVQPGFYTHQWQMLEEGVEWFGDLSNNHGITVANVVPTNDLSVVSTVGVGQNFSLTHTATNPTAIGTYLTGFRIHEERVEPNGAVYQDWVELNRVDPASGNRSFTTGRPAPDRPGMIRYHLRSWNQWMGEWDNLKEVTVNVPNRDPSVSIQILDGAQNPLSVAGNGNVRVPIGSAFFIRVNGSDPDGRLARLYSRINNPAGAGHAHAQVNVAGGSASYNFGPYTASSLGLWDIWAHSEDRDQSGYQWQGGGWWGAHSPDIEVYQPNRAPLVSLNINGVVSAGGTANTLTVSNGAMLNLATTASDPDGNFQRTRVWANYENQGWTEIRNTTAGFDGFLYTLSGIGVWQFHCRSVDNDGVESATAVVNVNSTNRTPSSLTLNSLPATMLLGGSVSLSSGAHDADGNLTRHMFWRRGPRGSDTFSQDWNGWQNYDENGAGWSNWSSPGHPSNPTNSSISATFTPPSPGYWQFHANAWDTHNAWGGGATSDSIFVAPQPSATITVSNGQGSVGGGGNISINVGQTVTIASSASAAGWLSEHNIYGYINGDPGNWFFPPSGGAWLPGTDSYAHSNRTVTWQPSTAGTYTFYVEAFTGRSGGERIGGTSGYPGYYDGSASKRITITVLAHESPNVNFTASATTLYVGQTLLLHSQASDINNDMALHTFWWDQGNGSQWTSPQFHYHQYAPNGEGWSNISNSGGTVANAANHTITASWSPIRPGLYQFHSNAQDARSGWGNGAAYEVTVPNRSPTVSQVILDGARNPITVQGNGNVRIPIGSAVYVRVTGTDPDNRLARLYSRLNNPAAAEHAHQQVNVSGTSASHDFGPYTLSTAGLWNVWVHAEDQDQSHGNGWGTAQSPDIEVYGPPTISMTVNGTTSAGGTTSSLTVSNGTILNFSTTGADADGNFQRTRVWTNFNGQGWSEIRNSSSASDTFTYTLAGVGTWQFHCRSFDNDGMESATAIIDVTSTNRVPTATFASLPATLRLGESLSVSSTATDADGNLNGHWLWSRGARTADTFSSDWDGWVDGPRNGVSLPNGWSNPAPSPHYNNPTNGSSNVVLATFTPQVPGYWQLLTHSADPYVWAPGAVSSAIFVAPAPATAISAKLGNVIVPGGGTLHMNTSEAVTLNSSASAAGWLSEHNIYGLLGGSFFAPAGGGAWLSASFTQTASTRSISWQPASPGSYTLYVESFTGRSGGERVNGHSGYPGYYNDESPDSERIFIVVHAPVDTDGDGIIDSWEAQNGFSLNDPNDALADSDGDGLSNLAEYNLGKNPRSYDSGTSQLGATIPAGWPTAGAVMLQAIGATAGELSVDKGGATTYQIPIAMTPGTAGMQPNLSLAYSSQGGAGIAGFGWSLTGLSSISRGPQTMAVDGQVRGVDFTNQDRFYLDGQRLIPISGTNGADGTEYRTEIDSFSRIVSYGYAGNGPARWRISTKAGLVVELGYTDNSQFRPYRKNGAYFSAGSEALIWSVSRIYDTAGNYMSFSYTENESEGSQLLSRIDYTGHLDPVVIPYASVRFEYETRSDTSVGYNAGARMSSTQRLKHVKAYYGETVVRTYSLSYTARNHTQRSLLISLTETGSDGTSYHPLVFEYAEPSHGWEQLDTAKWAPPVQFISGATQHTEGKPLRYGTGFVDLDGDARPDIIQWYHDSSGGNSHRRTAWMNLASESSGSNWFGLHNAWPPFPLAYRNRKDTGARLVDFDGDGLLDMIWHHVVATGVVESEAYRNSGNHWNESGPWHSIPSYRAPFPLAHDNANPAFASNFIDLNGDGRVDLIGRTDGINHAYLNTGSGWQHAPQWNAPADLRDGTSFLDVNGDGLPDLIQNWYGDKQPKQGVWFNNGNGWTACPSGELGNYLPPLMTASNPDYGRNSPVGTEFADINGDGLVDYIARNDAAGNYIAPQAWLNTGRGWERANSYDPPVALRHDHISRGIVFVDVNADGLVDLVRSYSGGNHVFFNTGRGWAQVDGAAILPMNVYIEGWKNENVTDLVDLNADGAIDQAGYWDSNRGAYRNLANPAQDRLVKVKNAFGVEARIAYGPLTARDAQTGDFTLYDKGAGSVFPKVEVIAPMYVTKSVAHDDGKGGEYTMSYRYGGLRSHAYRGSLGFEWMQSTDGRTGIRSRTWFNQEYPYVGMPSASETRTASNALLSESIVTYAEKSLSGGSTRFPYASESIQRSYELNGTLINESVTTAEYDNHGNATRLEIDSLDGHEKITVSTYDNWIEPASESGLGGWLLGRLKRSEVTASSPATASQTRVSSFGYNSATGFLTSEVVEPDRASDPANYTLNTAYGYDAFGNKTSVSTTGGGLALARTATTTYDSQGRFPTSTDNALNHTETYTYDQAKGVVVSTTGPNNLTTSWEYDGFVRKIKETRADTTVTHIRYRWPGAGAPSGTKYFIETESSGGPPAIACYDAMGRAFMGYSINGGKVDGNARIVVQKTEYDSMGRAYRASLPYYLNEAVPGWIETTAYDILSRPLTVATPNDDVAGGLAYSSVAYAGLVTTTTNAKGQVERIEKNSQGQVTRRVNNASAIAGSVERGEVTYTYDAFGQLLTTAVHKENGSTVSTSLTYDLRGRKTSVVDPDMGTWSYVYNAEGELISQTDAKGQITAIQYDRLGRFVRREQRVSAGANPVVTVWAYDTAAGAAKGKLHTVTTTGDGANASVGNNETYAYDSLGRVNQSTRLINGQTFTQHQSFDAFGRPLVATYPAGFQVKNIYNALGYLKEVRRADSGRNDLYWAADSYALDGRVNGEYFGNGMVVDRVYSEVTGRLRLSQSGVSYAATRAQDLSYTYDVLGNVLTRTDHAMPRSESFGYDGLNRLANHTIAGGAVVTLSYDSLGNITHKSDVGDYTYHSTRRHAVANTAGGVALMASSYAYDSNGNMTSGASRIYTWTLANQMKRAEKAGVWSEFQFDASHQRVLQTNNLGQTTYYISGSFEEVRHSGGLIERKYYISAPTGRVAVRVERSNGAHETRWFHSDGLGSINAVSDERGTIGQRFAYDAWGKRANPANGAGITSGTNGGISRGYTDHEHLDDLGLIHMNGRVYDPTLGRFLSADPFIDDAGDSQSYNRYSYVSNNPLNHTDPSGYFKLKDALIIIAVVVVSIITYGAATAAMTAAFGSAFVGGAVGGAITTTVAMTAAGFASGFAGSLLNGASLGNAFKAGLYGAAVGCATGLFGPLGGAATSGWIAENEGGKFGVGFSTSFIGSLGGMAPGNWYAKLAVSSIAGGTAAEIGGGKFANGAYSSALQYTLYNLPTQEQLGFSSQASNKEDNDTFSFRIGSVLEASEGSRLASRGSRGLNVQRTSVADIELAMMNRINSERNSTRRERMNRELARFRDAHGLRPPTSPSSSEIRAPKPKLITNPKHHQNSESPEPANVALLYQRSVLDTNGARYTRDLNGVIHRFSAESNGTTHWNGSTATPQGLHQNQMPSRSTMEVINKMPLF